MRILELYPPAPVGLFSAARFVPPGEVDWGGWYVRSSAPVGGLFCCGDVEAGISVTARAMTAGVTTFTAAAHGYEPGDTVTIAGYTGTDAVFNGTYQVIATPTANTFTVTKTLTGSVTNKALTTNVVTLTTGAAHGLVTGWTISVALNPADPVFDGTYVLTAASGTTLSYAKTNANVGAVATGGTYTVTAVPTGAGAGTATVGIDRRKPLPGGTLSDQFKPFLIYQVEGCTAGTARTPGELLDTAQSVQNRLIVNTEGWVSQALEVGTCGNKGLKDLTDVTGGGGTPTLVKGVQAMLKARRTAGLYDRPIVHMPGWVGLALDSALYLSQIVQLAIGPAYGVNAAVPAAAAGEAWIYMTGPIEYSVEEVYRGTGDEAGQGDDLRVRRQNRTFSLAERMAIYRFDPNLGHRTKVVY